MSQFIIICGAKKEKLKNEAKEKRKKAIFQRNLTPTSSPSPPPPLPASPPPNSATAFFTSASHLAAARTSSLCVPERGHPVASPLPESSSSSVSTVPPPPAPAPPPLSPESRAHASSSSPHSERGLQRIRARFGRVDGSSPLPPARESRSSHAAWPTETASARKAARASAGRRPVLSFFEVF